MTPDEPLNSPQKPRRRPRYSGAYPRRFEQKYKELNADKYPETLAKVLASGKTPAGAHRPIMVEEILDALQPRPGQVGVDVTLGYGGHAAALLERLQPSGKLIGLDTDPIELPKTTERLRAKGHTTDQFTPVHANFAGLPKVLAELGIPAVDFILADLGLSSMQIDNPERGFTWKAEGPLDLRMNPRKGAPASEWLRKTSLQELERIFRENADLPAAGHLAREVHGVMQSRPRSTTRHFANAIANALGPRTSKLELDKTIRLALQAIRIEINQEFQVLETFLRILPHCLKPGGRAALLTFHSGEDRRVKHAFKAGERDGTYAFISEPLRPSAAELRANPRSASAKLRWCIRAALAEPPPA